MNEETSISQDLIDMYSGNYTEDIIVETIEIISENSSVNIVNYTETVFVNGKLFSPEPFSVSFDTEEKDGTFGFTAGLFQTPMVMDILKNDDNIDIKYNIFRENKYNSSLIPEIRLTVNNISYGQNVVSLSGDIYRNANKKTPSMIYSRGIFPWL